MTYSYRHTAVKGAKYVPAIAVLEGLIIWAGQQFGMPPELTAALQVVAIWGGVAIYDFVKHRLGVRLP